jgi:microcystin-dependent protein
MSDRFAFSNFAVSTLREEIGTNDTTLRINVDDVFRFPGLEAGQKFPLVLATDDERYEVVYVSALTYDGTATVERARENTAAQNWLAGTHVRHTFTAATVRSAAGLTPTGNWLIGNSYITGDIVTHNGIAYIATQDNSGSEPNADSAVWQLIYAPPGSASSALAWADRWDSAVNYVAGQVVEWSGRLWRAKQNNNNSQPVIDSDDWQHIARASKYTEFSAVLALVGSANYVATIADEEAPPILYDGLTVRGRVSNNNTGAATLQINSLAAKPLRPKSGTDYTANQIVAGELYEFSYVAATGEFLACATPGVSSELGAATLSPSEIAFLQPLLSLFTGVILPFAGVIPDPSVALPCYGQEVNRVTYARLFTKIGTWYGAGNGSTTFNLPDLRGRTLIGVDPGDATGRLAGLMSAAAPNNVGGVAQHAISVAEMPAHAHGVTDPGHGHGVTDPGHQHTYTKPTANGNTTVAGAPGPIVGYSVGDAAASANATGISINNGATGVSIQNSGGGSPHENIQPSIAMNYIILT